MTWVVIGIPLAVGLAVGAALWWHLWGRKEWASRRLHNLEVFARDHRAMVDRVLRLIAPAFDLAGQREWALRALPPRQGWLVEADFEPVPFDAAMELLRDKPGFFDDALYVMGNHKLLDPVISRGDAERGQEITYEVATRLLIGWQALCAEVLGAIPVQRHSGQRERLEVPEDVRKLFCFLRDVAGGDLVQALGWIGILHKCRSVGSLGLAGAYVRDTLLIRVEEMTAERKSAAREILELVWRRGDRERKRAQREGARSE